MRKSVIKGKSILLVLLCFFPVLIFGSAIFDGPSEEKDPVASAQAELPTAIKISSSGARSATPLVVADSNGAAHVIWAEGVSARRNVFYNTNKGGTWRNPVNVSPDIKLGASGPWLDFAIDPADRLHYVLTAVSPYPNYEIYYKQFSNEEWQPSVNISGTALPDAGGSACPTIAASPVNNNCYVVWYDDIDDPDHWRLYFNSGKGNDWNRSSALPLGGGTYIPEIDVDDSDTAHLIWIQRRKGTSVVYYSFNSNPPDTNKWTSPMGISGETRQEWCDPDIAVDGQGNVYVAWIHNKDNNREIYVRRRINGKWGELENASKTPGSSMFPRIAVDKNNGNVYVVWQEKVNGKWQIYFNNAQDGKWSTATRITNNSADSVEPDIFVDRSGEIHVVYSDNSSGGFNIWYVSSSAMGDVITLTYPPLGLNMNTVLEGDSGSKKNILKWKKNPNNDNEYVKEYAIFRKLASQGVSAYDLRARVSKSTFRYEDSGLSADYKYSYVVATVNNDGDQSDYSNEVVEPLAYPPINLATSTDLDSSMTKKINTVTWKRNPRNGKITIKNYRIYRREEKSDFFNSIGTVSGSAGSYKDDNLSTGKKFVYRISAIDKFNKECEPSLPTFEDDVFPPIKLELKTIVNTGLYFTEKIIRLRWKKNPLNNPVKVVKYVVYRKKAEEAASSYKGLLVIEANTTEFFDRNLSQDDKYAYVVTTVCDNGAESEFSSKKVEK
ncbi:MAG: hypothetical protein JXB23_08285 [Candidatus Aminicenantes bacterium]|nr:hypothetical protein [Candidatus Aminicenantes bacterium]